MSPEDAITFAKRERAYRIGIIALVFCIVALAAVMSFASAETVYVREQSAQLVDFNPDNYTKEELADKVRSGQARVAEAYALEYAFCTSQPLGGDFAYAVGQTSIGGSVITSNIDCHLTNGQIRGYTVEYDQLRSSIQVDSRQGPMLPS